MTDCSDSVAPSDDETPITTAEDALIEAVKGYGPFDINQLKDALEKDPDVNYRDEEQWTALLYACERGSVEAVELLLEKGAVPDESNDSKKTPLSIAAALGHDKIVEALINTEVVEIDSTDGKGWTPLIHASSNGHCGIVCVLLEKGASTEAADRIGWNALRAASAHGHQNVVNTLLDHGTDINKTSQNGWSALMHATLGGHRGVMRLLIERGASVETADHMGWTVLARVCGGPSRLPLIKMLIAHGASMDGTGSSSRVGFNWSALRVAIINQKVEIAQFLLECGAEPNAVDFQGGTYLTRDIGGVYSHCTATQGAITDVLLTHGASLNVCDNSGRTPLRNGSAEAVMLTLLGHNASLCDSFVV